MEKDIVILIVLLSVITISLAVLFITIHQQKKTRINSQRDLSDRELLRLIAAQPDGIIDKKVLAEKGGISPAAAQLRLDNLYTEGVLKSSMSTNMMRRFYSLDAPLTENVAIPALSPEPFLTVDDILLLFQAFDFQLDYQKLIMATGLPLDILKSEMKYFEKEKVINSLMESRGTGIPQRKFFILQEPYRSDPSSFLSREKEMNQRVKELLQRDALL